MHSNMITKHVCLPGFTLTSYCVVVVFVNLLADANAAVNVISQ